MDLVRNEQELQFLKDSLPKKYNLPFCDHFNLEASSFPCLIYSYPRHDLNGYGIGSAIFTVDHAKRLLSAYDATT